VHLVSYFHIQSWFWSQTRRSWPCSSSCQHWSWPWSCHCWSRLQDCNWTDNKKNKKKNSDKSAYARCRMLLISCESEAVCCSSGIYLLVCKYGTTDIGDIVLLLTLRIGFMCSNIWKMSICLLWPPLRREPIYPQQRSLGAGAP